ncbi:unnamed protein product [Schistocephalus solidus]|uniref:Transcription initiation factor TFIID subunit 11 n=3 Tax=Schistocephalus solidus TaxID=70667 RepID=A0A183T4F6_SCHSO|nr:unnamed protein product [Schistocephalus solidus]
MDSGAFAEKRLLDSKPSTSANITESPVKKRLVETSNLHPHAPSSEAAPSTTPKATPDLAEEEEDTEDIDEDEEEEPEVEEEEDTGDLEEEDDGEEDDEEEEEEEEDETHLSLDFYDEEESVAGGSSRSATPLLEREREAKKAEDLKLLALMAHFNDDQLNRFEMFRRAAFTNTSVRRLIQSVAPCTFSKKVVIVMAGITKVFVGELIEAALDYKEQLKETGPLKPKHIRFAYARLQEEQRTSRPSRLNPLR